ncbi:MAG: hypothetical protein K8953_08870, partial [Proteobacteria bacterium]|nr:hypothetical protein [Pseudomonadota bacterium]
VTSFTSFALARTNRVTFCEIGGNESNALCMDTTLTNLCEFRPFSMICTGQPNTPNLRVASCLDVNNNSKDPSCTEVLLVNEADYLAIGDTPTTITEAIAGADLNIVSFFTDVGDDGVIDRGETVFTATPTTKTLRLGGDDTDTDDPNGVTYVRGVIGNDAYSFVGILPNTNLGAPLPIGMGQPASVEWTGRYYSELNFATHAIDFDIDFAMGTIDADDKQGVFTTTFKLNFTATGVITGVVTTTGSAPDTAQVRGLIGEKGLVGVFANTDTETNSWTENFHGGFVAENPSYTPPTNDN